MYAAAPVDKGAEIDPASLKDIPLFAGVSRRVRKIVAQHTDEVELAANTEIVSEGGLAHELFFIVDGTADVFEGRTKIAELGPGDVVGEIGVLKTHKRIATVIATSPIKALVMYGSELTALRETMPEVFSQLETLIEERLSR
jgi:CRP-like cAMP-binding protein